MAQFGSATALGAVGRVFKSHHLDRICFTQSPFRLEVKAVPFHGKDMGSIPIRDNITYLVEMVNTVDSKSTPGKGYWFKSNSRYNFTLNKERA